MKGTLSSTLKHSAKVHCPLFRRLTVLSIFNTVNVGDGAFSVDLTDAYLHVPIQPDGYKYLRLALEGKALEFRILPFDLNTAPRRFLQILHQLQPTQDITSLGVWFLLKKKNYSSTRKNKLYTKLTNKIDQQTLVTYKQATSFMVGPSESQTGPIATAYPRK